MLRPAFAPGSGLTAADLNAEQAQRRQRLSRHLRYLHGAGVVCGLEVKAAGHPARPWAVWVCPGYAIGPHGDEILVPERVLVDVHDALWKKRPASKKKVAHLVIRGVVEGMRPRRSPRRGAGADDFVLTRAAERFDISAVWSAPRMVPAPRACGPSLKKRPPCPVSAFLVLASVRLPPEGALIEPRHIHVRI